LVIIAGADTCAVNPVGSSTVSIGDEPSGLMSQVRYVPCGCPWVAYKAVATATAIRGDTNAASRGRIPVIIGHLFFKTRSVASSKTRTPFEIEGGSTKPLFDEGG
jgi:hypothetical protein